MEQMETQKEKYTFEMLMQSFEKSRIEMEAMRAEADRRAAEREKEWQEIRQKMKETSEKIDKHSEQIKEQSKMINGISESNGAAAEETIYNSLERDMTFAGIRFDSIEKNRKKYLKKLKLKGEYDVLLENGDVLALIETKYRVRKDDVFKFATTKLDIFRKLYPMYDKYKIILGVGGMSFDDDAIKEAEEYGVGIIKIVGDKVEYYTEGIKTY